MIRRQKTQAGFSLFELAIAMTLLGLVLSSSLAAFREYSRVKSANDAQEKKTTVEYALSRFVATQGRMPCPADPTLSLNSANGGVENCMLATTGFTCTGAGGTGGVCRVVGGRDTAADVESVNPDTVLIGAVPYVSLGIAAIDTIDSWGGKMTYAVSESLTPAGSFNEDYGVISKQIFNTATSAYENAANPLVTSGGVPLTDSFSYALISHGPDRKGAYSYEGILLASCGSTTASADAENCDNDSVFRDTSRKSVAANNAYYDDAFVAMGLIRDSDKWQYTGDPSAIRSKQGSGGNVGIGKWNPVQPLDVNGNILLEGMHAESYCNESGNNCFRPELIGGAGDNCGGGTFNGIQSSAAACNIQVNLGAVVSQTCPTGKKIKGFTSSGIIVCGS
jgi:prepilin-type N-terminal cleavage/methylation domain-containing protein